MQLGRWSVAQLKVMTAIFGAEAASMVLLLLLFLLVSSLPHPSHCH
jgi:hypothetical protein